MIIIIQLLAFISLTTTFSQDSINRLKNTKHLHFTYFYQHIYQQTSSLQINVEFQKAGSNLNQLLSSLNSSYFSIKTQIQKYDAFIVNASQRNATSSFLIGMEQNFQLLSSITIQAASQPKLNDLLESLLNISKYQNIKIGSIERQSSKGINYEVTISLLKQQDAKIHQNAQKKSQAICLRYFNMKLKKILLLEKVQKNNSNNTANQDFIGNLYEANEQIIREKDIASEIQLNQFFQCQIVCQNTIKNINIPKVKSKQRKSTKKLLGKLNNQKKKNKEKANKKEKVKKSIKIKLQDQL